MREGIKCFDKDGKEIAFVELKGIVPVVIPLGTHRIAIYTKTDSRKGEITIQNPQTKD